MEQVKLMYVNHYHADDFDELNLRITAEPTKESFAEPVTSQSNFLLQVDAETHQVIGATILYADDWFARIAEAFQRGDLNDPDVRFFLEQKFRQYAQEWESRQAKVTLAV